ncbi:hypothetical protein Q3O60_12020 [Alkalimonas collagenimarina]|uniref:Secreted protein n=1 Tax=Alkalimonas collagenimarina TaxID=400390 RepID=A0ABT9H1H5_9GAMM|nr:hypothetical protein [Alkalimonas collagenimarina]MDP4536919.1 hypothetical protein [Alkalimonas collagenimarina]
MKKVFIAMAATLAFTAGSVAAQDQAGGSAAGAFGDVKTEHVVAGVVGVAVAAAIISNSRSTSIDDGGGEDCGPGEELVDGECQPIEPPVTGTVTGTGTGTMTVTTTGG